MTPPLALGIDQSLKASGLVLVSWNVAGGAKPLWWRTVRNLTPSKVQTMVIELAEFVALNYIELLALEGSFWSPSTPDQGMSHAETRGMWRQAILTNWTRCEYAQPRTTREWRPKYLGSCKDGWTREGAEEAAVKLAEAHGIDHDLTVHIAEALGIISVACTNHNWKTEAPK